MGQGGFLKITNLTPYTMRRTGQSSYQMNNWNLPDNIQPRQSKRSYVEFNEGVFKTLSDTQGWSGYSLVGSNDGTGKEYTFVVRVKFTNISVDIQNMAARTLPASVPPQSPVINLGWKHNGVVNFSLADIGRPIARSKFTLSKPLRMATLDEQLRIKSKVHKEILTTGESEHDLTNQRLQEAMMEEHGEEHVIMPTNIGTTVNVALSQDLTDSSWLASWMWQYQPFIGEQKLTDLILPGTHDSGTYDMVSILAKPWTKCQNLNLTGQLSAGARVLDLRVGIQMGAGQGNEFILVHDTWRSKTTLEDALNQVVGFCSSNSGEVVILDFHSFIELNGTYDQAYEGLVGLVKNKLGSLIIPNSESGKSYNEIVSSSGRVVVAWNNGKKDKVFWPGVDQQWYNKPNKDELHGAIAKAYSQNLPDPLWSCCAIITPRATDPSPIQSLSPDLSLWFASDSTWSQKSNIVSCDFIETTQLAQSLVLANLVKASQG